MNPEKGYRAFIDEHDFVNWYVAAELTGNIDALYSIYMYKEAEEEKIHFGPLWDLDLGYDNSSERSLLRSMEAYLGLWNRPFEKVLKRMWQDPWFAKACNDRLQELVDNGLQQYLIQHIDSLRDAIFQTQAQNFRKWRIDQQVYDWEKHSYYRNYDSYIADLKNFVNIHIPYLQQAFAERMTTGIRVIQEDSNTSVLYDLQGRRVPQSSRKGIYIQNHRKIVKQ